MRNDNDPPEDNKVVRLPLGNNLQISAYFHCSHCLRERPKDISPREYNKLSIGWTLRGLQVWCDRHNCNVVNIDFQGQKHPANTTADK